MEINAELEQLKYPIGKRVYNGPLTAAELENCILDISLLPERLAAETEYLEISQLDTPYRPGGWTVRQVVHHLSDSHMNGFIRCKLALTEPSPTIKPYAEALWAGMDDYLLMPVETGILLLTALHKRWTMLLKSLSSEDLKKTYVHPEYGKVFTLDEVIHLYAWHCNHHLAHITGLKKRQGWK